MALRYSCDMSAEADIIEQAIAKVLDNGLRTADIMQSGLTKVGTEEMGKANRCGDRSRDGINRLFVSDRTTTDPTRAIAQGSRIGSGNASAR